MNYMNEIFWRTDIQQIREFLLHGVEKLNIDTRTYKERIRRGYVDSFVSAIKRRFNLQSLGAYIRDAARTLYRGHFRRYALHYKSAIYPYHAGNNGTLFYM
jgi:hypothetical protein